MKASAHSSISELQRGAGSDGARPPAYIYLGPTSRVTTAHPILINRPIVVTHTRQTPEAARDGL
jgi:hypothetical protein